MKKTARILFLLISACLYMLSPAWAEGVRNIDVQEAADLIRNRPDDVFVLDVRTPGEFQEGHIPGARNLDFFGGNFENELQSLPKNRDVLVYCRSGQRSEAAGKALEKAGYTKILHMNEGFSAWEKADLPVED